jgi:DNA-binding NtrC family response regulator
VTAELERRRRPRFWLQQGTGVARLGHTLITDLATGETLSMALWLVVVAGREQGRRIRLRTGTVVVGASRDVDVTLDDPRLSRSHASFELVSDGVRVRDLGSRNGTRVNGAPITEAVLRPGGVVELGDTVLVVDGEGAAVEPPPSTRRAPAARGALSSGEGEPFVAHGASMRRVVAVLERAARSDVTVLLQGESGTGKDVAARALHAGGARKKGPFVVVDCGAIAPGLVASELFGHKKGAFTSAQEDRVGAFEAARGGTLFLDEIGELPLALQPTLLRVLETRQVTRVGETHSRDVDVRVVAATNRRLKDEVDAGRFRADLFFRLAVVSVSLLPLRERRDEILPLATRFLREHGRSLDDLADGDRQRLLSYAWPGNVRELRNVILRGCVLTGLDEKVRLGFDEERDPRDAREPPAVRGAPAAREARGVRDLRGVRRSHTDDDGHDSHSDGDDGHDGDGGDDGDDGHDGHELLQRTLPEARRRALDALDRRYLSALLTACDGNVSAAARRAGVARSYLHRLLSTHKDALPARRGRTTGER